MARLVDSGLPAVAVDEPLALHPGKAGSMERAVAGHTRAVAAAVVVAAAAVADWREAQGLHLRVARTAHC